MPALAQAQREGASQNQAFTIEQAVEYATQNSARMRTSRLSEQIARREIKETVSQGLPQINGSVEYNYFPDIPTTVLPDFISPQIYGVLREEQLVDEVPSDFGTVPAAFGVPHQLNAGVNLSQLVFDGQYIIGIRASKTYAELRAAETEQQRVETEAAVRKAYYRAQLTRRNFTIVRRNLDQLDRQLYETRKLYENGFAEELDVDRLRLSRKRLENNLQNLEANVESAYKSLKLQMGYPMADTLYLRTQSEQVESYIEGKQKRPEVTYNERIEYRINRINQNLAVLDRKRWEMGYLPTVRFNALHQQQAQRQAFNFFEGGEWFPNTLVGGTISIPIFDGFRKASKIQQAKLQGQQLQVQQDNLEEQITFEARQAQLEYNNAYQNYQTQKESQELAEKIYRTTEKKYENGLGSSLELTTAQTDWYNAQSDYISATLRLLEARVELNRALGEY
jgi:outer membrane protein TolC